MKFFAKLSETINFSSYFQLIASLLKQYRRSPDYVYKKRDVACYVSTGITLRLELDCNRMRRLRHERFSICR